MDLFCDLGGKIAVVTGGNQGIGLALAQGLAKSKAKVIIVNRRPEEGEKAAQGIRGAGGEAISIPADVSKKDSVEEMVKKALDQYGRIDVLVNNAVTQYHQDWNDDAKLFAMSMQVNATGIYIITRAFGNIMAKQREGSIINIASVFGMVGPNRSFYEGGFEYLFPEPDYHFHKGGLISFTRYVASYYGPQNVRCNSISPGGKKDKQIPSIFKSKEQWEEIVNRWSNRTQLGKMGDDTFLKGVIVFLASEASSYLTGTNIPVDGGYAAI